MKDLMLDIEAMGSGPDAVIVQVGAAYFNRNTGNVCDTFLQNVSLASADGRFSGSTIHWWLQQALAGNKLTFLQEAREESNVLKAFREFASDADFIWSHATFDFVIVQSALSRHGLKPLSYRCSRDIQTLVDLSGLPRDKKEKINSHDALDDCLYQIKYCVECFKNLRS